MTENLVQMNCEICGQAWTSLRPIGRTAVCPQCGNEDGYTQSVHKLEPMNDNPRVGSSFDSFLKEEGILEEVEATALKRVQAHDPGGRIRVLVGGGICSSASFAGPGDCYRYKLERKWDDAAPVSGSAVLFAMMNPSVADITHDDLTVAKCGRLARRWGYSRLLVGNACAYRCTSPQRLLEVADPVGPGNHAALAEMAAQAALVVVAHGRLPRGLQHHADAMVRTLRGGGCSKLRVLRLTADGVPMHPLARGKGHIPEDIQPMLWSAEL